MALITGSRERARIEVNYAAVACGHIGITRAAVAVLSAVDRQGAACAVGCQLTCGVVKARSTVGVDSQRTAVFHCEIRSNNIRVVLIERAVPQIQGYVAGDGQIIRI